MTKHFLIYAGPEYKDKNGYSYEGISIEEAKQRAIKQACVDYEVEDIKEDEEKDKLKKDKEKAREIEAAREGTSQLSAVDPNTLPSTPSGGTNIP